MFGAVMGKVASLTERREIEWIVVAWIVIEVGAGEYHPRGRWQGGHCEIIETQLARLHQTWRRKTSYPPSPIIPPLVALLVKPSSVTEMIDALAVWTSTPLAATSGSAKADRSR